ncbi:myb/SANT-like DNA-binding domain-containing protein 7 [Antechinus flavipes]|uniref:myb/SANT-like DNA-binding domain-containing protein 7 n=1 Tax=Antechinus flavipes TaxID=38775 RepID=UPI0022363320|nr:myb/SANT-like DNA-binding domain-containing protein 7 [Antechinus flavipes]
MDPEYLKDNVMQLRHRDQNLRDLDTLMEEEARVQEVPQDLTIRQHSTWWEAEETDVSHLPIKTENNEEPVDQTPGYSQDFTCNTSCSFLKEENVPLSSSMATAGASCKAEPENDTCQSPSFLSFSSSKTPEDGPLPNQPPPRRIRQRRRSLANTISAEMARNRRLTWDLARRSEAHLDRLIAIGERANAQREVDNSLRRESVIAVNQLATTVEGAISALHQFNELLDHSLNPGKS